MESCAPSILEVVVAVAVGVASTGVGVTLGFGVGVGFGVVGMVFGGSIPPPTTVGVGCRIGMTGVGVGGGAFVGVGTGVAVGAGVGIGVGVGGTCVGVGVGMGMIIVGSDVTVGVLSTSVVSAAVAAASRCAACAPVFAMTMLRHAQNIKSNAPQMITDLSFFKDFFLLFLFTCLSLPQLCDVVGCCLSTLITPSFSGG